MAAKTPGHVNLAQLLDLLRAQGVTQYEGPLPGSGGAVVKLTFTGLVQPNPRAATPITDVTKPAEVPKELAAAGVTPDQYAESVALAAALNPLA